jgi:hypothetical protein
MSRHTCHGEKRLRLWVVELIVLDVVCLCVVLEEIGVSAMSLEDLKNHSLLSVDLQREFG